MKGVVTIFVCPYMIDLCPQANQQDLFAEQLVEYFDEHLADLALSYGVAYVATRVTLHERMNELESMVDFPHYSVVNGIHLTMDGNNVLGLKVLQAIFEQIEIHMCLG